MNTTPKPKRKMLLAAGSIALATAALTFGVAGAANAATGTTGGGTRNVTVIPNTPATDFSAAGTTGYVQFDNWDGITTSGTYSVNAGESTTRVVTLPTGLAWAAGICPSPVPSGQICTLSPNGRTLTKGTTTSSAATGLPALTSPNLSLPASFPIVSTGPVSGPVSVTYVPYPGITSPAPTAVGAVPGSVVGNLSAGTPNADGSVPLSGIASPGATITVKDATGATVGTTTADANGNWSVTIPAGVTPPLSITQTSGGVTSAPVTFNEAPLPVLNPAVALGVLALAGAGIGGAVLVRRRRQQHVATA